MQLEKRIQVYQRGTKPTEDGFKLTPKQARRVKKLVNRVRGQRG